MKELIKPIKAESKYSEIFINAMCTENDCDCGCGQFNYNSARNRSNIDLEDDVLF